MGAGGQGGLAGECRKVGQAHLDRDRPASHFLPLQASRDPLGQTLQDVFQFRFIGEVGGEGCLGGDRLGLTLRVHRLPVLADGPVADCGRPHSEGADKPVHGLLRQLADGFHSSGIEPLRRLGANAPQLAGCQRGQEPGFISRRHHHEAVGLVEVRGDLGDGLVGCDTHGHGEAGLVDYPPFQAQGDTQRPPPLLFVHRFCDVQVGLVQR